MKRITGNIFLSFWCLTILAGSDAEIIEYSLIVPKKKIYMGQTINFQLEFKYPAAQYLRLRSIQDPEIPGINGIKIVGPDVHEELHNNIRYRLFTWNGTCKPVSAGKLVIPALRALFNIDFEIQERFSQPVEIEVKNVPQAAQTDKEINALGKFTAILLKSDKTDIEAGTAQKIYAKITGVAHGSLKAPKLLVPDGLKYYESNSVVEEKPDSGCYNFEYIVQAVKPGNYKINIADFLFFDPVAEKHTRLTSNVLHFTVKPASKQVMPAGITAQRIDAGDKIALGTDPAKLEQLDIESQILEKIVVYQNNKTVYALPWSIFGAIVLILSILVLREIYYYYISSTYHEKKYAFVQARKNIVLAAKQNNGSLVYGILKAAIAQRCQIPEITDDIIEQKLQEVACSPDLIDQWKQFSHDLLVPAFSCKNYPFDNRQLFILAHEWVGRFEKLL